MDIGTALAAMKIAVDALKGASGTLNKTEIQKAVGELQSALLDAHGVALGLQADVAKHQKTISELEAKIAQVDDWNNRAACYDLVESSPGTLNWIRRFDTVRGKLAGIDEPIHYACSKCFNEKTFVLLMGKPFDPELLQCPTCKTIVQTRPTPPPQRSFEATYPGDDPRFI